MASNYYVTIYHPIKGWAPVVMGPEGPEETGSGHHTPQEAIAEGESMATELDIRTDFPKITPCPYHPDDWRIEGRCESCALIRVNSRGHGAEEDE